VLGAAGLLAAACSSRARHGGFQRATARPLGRESVRKTGERRLRRCAGNGGAGRIQRGDALHFSTRPRRHLIPTEWWYPPLVALKRRPVFGFRSRSFAAAPARHDSTSRFAPRQLLFAHAAVDRSRWAAPCACAGTSRAGRRERLGARAASPPTPTSGSRLVARREASLSRRLAADDFVIDLELHADPAFAAQGDPVLAQRRA